MAQYGVFRNTEGEGYLLDVQTDLLDGLNTRIVVPLLPRAKAPAPAQRLNPTFEAVGASFVMMTQYLFAVPASLLGTPVDDLEDQFDQITAALDILFHGFCNYGRAE